MENNKPKTGRADRASRRYHGTNKAIMIVTQEIDPHSDLMVLHLERRGIKPVRFHPQSLGTEDRLTVKYQTRGGWEWHLEGPGGRVSSREIGSIWYRRTMFSRNPQLTEEEAEFSLAETRHAVMGAFRMTETFWVSHPDALHAAESKPLQLKLAGKAGFNIPRTLITDDAEEFLAFYHELDGRVVYKTLTQSPLAGPEPKGVYTNIVKKEHLDRLETITANPCIFQEQLPKTFDLRVTVIGEKVFAVEIHSQDDTRSMTDWRRGSSTELKHVPHNLPQGIERSCHALLKLLDIRFGAIDLVMTPDGKYVFLEINPSGQFAWIEGLTGLPLVETLADLLISGCD